MNNNTSITNTTNGELTYKNPENANESTEISVPPGLIDTVNKILQEKFQYNDDVLKNKETADKLWKVTINPKFQGGIEKGSLVIKDGSLDIRNAKTGKFIGKAQLNEIKAEELAKKNKPSSLSNISRNIASISGQLQMAEISKKLDKIQNKLDLLGQFLWREKVSKLKGLNSVIEEAIESLPNSNAIERINDCIKDLMGLSKFFEDTIDDILKRKIERSLVEDFKEGLKVWEWRNRCEYNKKYNDEISAFINEYGFLLDLYFQTLFLIATCYQITNEYHHASKYYKKVDTGVSVYASELVNKLIYLLNIEGISVGDEVPLLDVDKRLSNRRLPRSISREVNLASSKIDEVKNMHERLITQFEEIQITYNVDSKLLLGDSNDD